MPELEVNPGRELDLIVIEKVLKWREGADFDVALDGSIYRLPVELHAEDLSEFSPSVDIAAAWQVFEGFSSRYIDWDDSDASYSVRLDPKRRLREDCRGTGYADTAPHAICLAALEAIGA